MKLTRKIKTKLHPSVVGGFTRYWSCFKPGGYYKNRGISHPFSGGEIGRIESVRFICS